jgi:hypothetical protein
MLKFSKQLIINNNKGPIIKEMWIQKLNKSFLNYKINIKSMKNRSCINLEKVLIKITILIKINKKFDKKYF